MHAALKVHFFRLFRRRWTFEVQAPSRPETRVVEGSCFHHKAGGKWSTELLDSTIFQPTKGTKIKGGRRHPYGTSRFPDLFRSCGDSAVHPLGHPNTLSELILLNNVLRAARERERERERTTRCARRRPDPAKPSPDRKAKATIVDPSGGPTPWRSLWIYLTTEPEKVIGQSCTSEWRAQSYHT